MSNLGLYQVMTTVAAVVGGPLILTGLVAGAGYLAGKCIEKAVNKAKQNQNNNIEYKNYCK